MSAWETIRNVLLVHYANTPNPTLTADTLAANGRAEVLAEVSTWLVKKAREFRAAGETVQADTAALLASKVARGAVRPDNLRMLPADFFEPGRTYRHTNSHGDTWEFRVVAIDRDPANTLQAIGWLGRVGSTVWHASCRGTVGWASEGWTDIAESEAADA